MEDAVGVCWARGRRSPMADGRVVGVAGEGREVGRGQAERGRVGTAKVEFWKVARKRRYVRQRRRDGRRGRRTYVGFRLTSPVWQVEDGLWVAGCARVETRGEKRKTSLTTVDRRR